MTPYDQKTQEVVAEIRNYNISINREQKLELFTDGLCENPGAMHIGLFARQGNNCLFTRHTFAGHGTCNEAEYIAVKTGLTILQALYPEPGVPVVVCCDSQLVTKQVNNLWKSSGKMRDYCIFLRRLRKTYPYTLQKIPRSENEMADGLAQKYILKNSGRCMTLENGRFNVLKQVPATVKRSDTYKAVTSQQFRDYLGQHNLHGEMQRLLQMAVDGDIDAAIALAQSIQQRAGTILELAPKTNDLVAQWLGNTIGLMQKGLDLVVAALRQREDVVEIQYIIEELSGPDSGESEIFSQQIGHLRERGLPETVLALGEEDDCFA
jgi:ribonuclease HI